MKKGWIIAVSIILVIAIVLGVVYFVVFGHSKKYGETENLTVGDGQTLKVGIISDSQLPDGDDNSRWTENLKMALETLKSQNVDVIIHAGDFTDVGTVGAWKSFKKVYDEVFPKDGPVKCFVMGNHDHWLTYFVECWDIPTPARQQNKFTKYTGELPYTHKVINGYHFINWSSGNGTYDKSYQNEDWIRAQLDAAVRDDPNKPIFVTTHINPLNTIYGSSEEEGWGNADIYRILKDYPQVVSFSGHSHYSLLDERSIWQSEFTAVGTETIDYIELEPGKFNGSVPKDAYGDSLAKYTPMGMIMTVSSDGVKMDRISTKTGEQAKQSWNIQVPFSADTAEYTKSKRTENNKAPYFEGDIGAKITATIDNDANPINVLSFNSAKDEDFVHSYKLVFKDSNGDKVTFDKTDYSGEKVMETDEDDNELDTVAQISERLYFSDFTKGLGNMSNRTELRLPKNLPDEVTQIDICGIDSWGAETETVTFKITK